ncbi:MAG TPA: copper homeostasis protein CutC [Saprospiraceae bacterium]
MNFLTPFQLEACVVSLSQAKEAEQKGAHRVELCARLETEGMTPAFSLVKSLIEQLHIPVRVMIRATESGYEAHPSVLKEMIDSITTLKQLPVDGFVFGVMKDNRVDRAAMTILLDHAAPFPVTFHKAIDTSDDIMDDLKWLNHQTLVDTILTSGGAIKAIDGIEKILEMKSQFHGQIMAAGKITSDVLPTLHETLQLTWYHGRSIV